MAQRTAAGYSQWLEPVRVAKADAIEVIRSASLGWTRSAAKTMRYSRNFHPVEQQHLRYAEQCELDRVTMADGMSMQQDAV